MSETQQNQGPKRAEAVFESVDIGFFEVNDTNSVVDTTVRPMRDSLRKWLGLPPRGVPPSEGSNQPPKP